MEIKKHRKNILFLCKNGNFFSFNLLCILALQFHRKQDRERRASKPKKFSLTPFIFNSYDFYMIFFIVRINFSFSSFVSMRFHFAVFMISFRMH